MARLIKTLAADRIQFLLAQVDSALCSEGLSYRAVEAAQHWLGGRRKSYWLPVTPNFHTQTVDANYFVESDLYTELLGLANFDLAQVMFGVNIDWHKDSPMLTRARLLVLRGSIEFEWIRGDQTYNQVMQAGGLWSLFASPTRVKHRATNLTPDTLVIGMWDFSESYIHGDDLYSY